MEQFNVTGMSCAACSARVEKAVSRVPGVTSCSVSLLTNSMGVEGSASDAAIIKAVQDAGYGARLPGTLKPPPMPVWMGWRTGRPPGSGGGFLPLWAFCWY